MTKHTEKSEVIDALLRLVAFGAVTATVLTAPAALLALDKPLGALLDTLDERARKREIARTLSYMRYTKLIAGDYQQGLVLTEKAKKRLAKKALDSLTIVRPEKWDNIWRIIFFDIPENEKRARDAFAGRIRKLGFAVLQRSVFVCPFPCREEVAALTEYYGVSTYLTYIETAYIDNDKPLRKYFDL